MRPRSPTIRRSDASKFEKAVPAAIRLLEANNYQGFLRSFDPPEELQQIAERTSFAQFAAMFGERQAARMLDALKSIQHIEPTLDDTGTRATYPLDAKEFKVNSLIFIKIGKYWYIKN